MGKRTKNMAKHKMYDETPSLAHDEEGNVKVKKAEKKAEVKGDDHEPDGAGLDELIKQHDEMKKMHDKHQADMMARIQKHSKKAADTSDSDSSGTPVNNK